MVGLPASGKSTVAKEYQDENSPCNIHSSDAIREELSGDVNRQDINQLVFDTLHKRIKEDLASGINCIYDATNLSWKRRKHFLSNLSLDCNKIALLVATPYEVCLERNKSRDRVVPKDVIRKMYLGFWMPIVQEGFDEVIICHTGYKNSVSMVGMYKEGGLLYKFNQHNPHHTLTLDEHMLIAAARMFEEYKSKTSVKLIMATVLHDIGKPFTQTFAEDGTAHYYSHHNVGAYNSLFLDYFEKSDEKNCDIFMFNVAALINYHMTMYNLDKEITKEKYRQFLGDKMMEELRMLHDVDKAAH